MNNTRNRFLVPTPQKTETNALRITIRIKFEFDATINTSGAIFCHVKNSIAATGLILTTITPQN